MHVNHTSYDVSYSEGEVVTFFNPFDCTIYLGELI